MPKTKTAISIESDLLEEAGSIADEMDISRSKIVSMALEEYIRRYQNKKLLEKINEAYSDGIDPEDEANLEIIRSHRRKLGDREEWK